MTFTEADALPLLAQYPGLASLNIDTKALVKCKPAYDEFTLKDILCRKQERYWKNFLQELDATIVTVRHRYNQDKARSLWYKLCSAPFSTAWELEVAKLLTEKSIQFIPEILTTNNSNLDFGVLVQNEIILIEATAPRLSPKDSGGFIDIARRVTSRIVQKIEKNGIKAITGVPIILAIDGNYCGFDETIICDTINQSGTTLKLVSAILLKHGTHIRLIRNPQAQLPLSDKAFRAIEPDKPVPHQKIIARLEEAVGSNISEILKRISLLMLAEIIVLLAAGFVFLNLVFSLAQTIAPIYAILSSGIAILLLVQLALMLSNNEYARIVSFLLAGTVGIILLQANNIPIISPTVTYTLNESFGRIDSANNVNGISGELLVKVRPPTILFTFFDANCGWIRLANLNSSYRLQKIDPLLTIDYFKGGPTGGTLGIKTCALMNGWSQTELKAKLDARDVLNVPEWMFCTSKAEELSKSEKIPRLQNLSAIRLYIEESNPNSYPLQIQSYFNISGKSIELPCFTSGLAAPQGFFKDNYCYEAIKHSNQDDARNGIALALSSTPNGNRIARIETNDTLVIAMDARLNPTEYKQEIVDVYRSSEPGCN